MYIDGGQLLYPAGSTASLSQQYNMYHVSYESNTPKSMSFCYLKSHRQYLDGDFICLF